LNEKVFSKMAKEIPLYAERFALVDTLDEYYIIVAFIDLFEFIFRLYKTKMIDEKLWFRWKALATAINTCQSLQLYGTEQS
jgi:3-methyladenine DNA glycosylase AlkD